MSRTRKGGMRIKSSRVYSRKHAVSKSVKRGHTLRHPVHSIYRHHLARQNRHIAAAAPSRARASRAAAYASRRAAAKANTMANAPALAVNMSRIPHSKARRAWTLRPSRVVVTRKKLTDRQARAILKKHGFDLEKMAANAKEAKNNARVDALLAHYGKKRKEHAAFNAELAGLMSGMSMGSSAASAAHAASAANNENGARVASAAANDDELIAAMKHFGL